MTQNTEISTCIYFTFSIGLDLTEITTIQKLFCNTFSSFKFTQTNILNHEQDAWRRKQLFSKHHFGECSVSHITVLQQNSRHQKLR